MWQKLRDLGKGKRLVQWYFKKEVNFMYNKVYQNGRERKIKSEELLTLSSKSAVRHLSS